MVNVKNRPIVFRFSAAHAFVAVELSNFGPESFPLRLTTRIHGSMISRRRYRAPHRIDEIRLHGGYMEPKTAERKTAPIAGGRMNTGGL